MQDKVRPFDSVCIFMTFFCRVRHDCACEEIVRHVVFVMNFTIRSKKCKLISLAEFYYTKQNM